MNSRAFEGQVRGRLRWRAAVLIPALVSTLLVAGCGDPKAADLCTHYKQATTRADEIKDLHPSTETAAELRDKLATFDASLDQLQEAADGRLDTVITNLRAAVQDFVEAAVDNGKQALKTAQPLLDDSRDEVAKQWGLLKQKADDECDVG